MQKKKINGKKFCKRNWNTENKKKHAKINEKKDHLKNKEKKTWKKTFNVAEFWKATQKRQEATFASKKKLKMYF